jgi:hypothetical protein
MDGGGGDRIEYKPPGEQAARFHQSKAFVKGLMGPVGSGKSSTCVMEIVAQALKQKPFNGVRESRWAVIRNTYPELKSTTIKTWQNWVPESLCPIKWDAPITARFKVKDIGDGTSLDLEVIFLALDKAQETGKLRSLELTGAWINECSEVPKEIFDMVTQRVGRFPPKTKGGPSYPCILLDTNPPDDEHWYYKFAEEETPDGWEFYRQAGGLYREDGQYKPHPDAENISNLTGGYEYYLRQLGGKTDDWISVFLMGDYGTTADGKPVYPEYNDRIHVAEKDLKPILGLPIILGWDFGLTPAVAICQMTPRGQFIVLEELVAEDMGIRQFATDVVKPVILNKYAKHRIESCGDPAGMNRAQTDERTCFQELLEVGLPTEPANTNDFIPRRESVAFFLNRMAGGEPGFLIDANCKTLRKGFIGGYRYERLKVSGEIYRERPVKDRFSHIHDALQYACLRVRTTVQPVRAKALKKTNAKGWT